MGKDFMVKRDDLEQSRVAEAEPVDLEPGQALLRVDSFGLTANNVTYAVFGEAISYWDFFPAPEGWGRIPAWGFAEVEASEHEDLEQGKRVFGYLPMSDHLVVTPDRVEESNFIDASPHRSNLPPAYNSYRLVAADPIYDAQREDQQMLLWPLFATSFLIDDQLDEEGFFDAGAVVLSSASSKTALGTAFLLSQRDGIVVIGLTSPAHVGFVEGVGAYDRVVSYEDVGSLPTDKAVYVDMSGNGTVREAIHRHYGEELAHDYVVGDTHWDQLEGPAGDMPGPQPAFFFAPDRIIKRTKDWGGDGFGSRLADAWLRLVDWSDRWLEVKHGSGPEAVEQTYLEVLAGRTEPSVGHVLSMRS